MGFFSKRKNENNGFIINTDDEPIKISGDKNLAPHAMTAEEVSGLWVLGDEDENYTNTSALDSLKKRMAPKSEQNKPCDIATTPKTEHVVLTDEPPESQKAVKSESVNESEEKTVEISNTANKAISDITKNSEPKSTEIEDTRTLLEKLKRYTVDEKGQDMSKSSAPLYQLESVAEILKNNSEDAMKSLSAKYGLDISIDTLGKAQHNDTHAKVVESHEQTDEPKKIKENVTPTPAFEKMVTDAEKRESRKLYETLFHSEDKKINFDISVPDISDIDTHEAGITLEKNTSDTATIRFTPVKDSLGNTNHISISSVTKHVDLGDEVVESVDEGITAQILDQSEFEKFSPKYEMTDVPSGKKIMRRLAIKKRSLFLSCFISIIAVLALLVFFIPSVNNFIISNPKGAMWTCGAFLFVSTAANFDMFIDFKNLLKKRCSFDILASLCAVLTLSLSVCAATKQKDAFFAVFMCAIILLVRAVCKFRETSAMLDNLRQISNDRPKNAVTLISDTATTFAMAKNTIEGDVLAAAHRKTDFVEDYMKHSTLSAKFAGKTSLVFYITLGFAILSGITAFFYYKSAYDAFYCATIISCIAAMPSLFLIDSLPLSFAAKKLNSKGAMISGIYGAEKLEMVNAAVVNINDIFPSGTVSMYSMKVLSNNSIDETILKAASLTAAVNSPLEAIFKQIAGTNSSYTIPDSDTVKYEKRLGISGWVDNELLFIGNRSLMEAHGIEIPSIEVDKKILRKGYFPVYVATATTACTLIVIQYDVRQDIAKELRKITELGVTLLVDNCDPNINEEMLCDYFGLYEDSVKIMSNAGVYMYKNATPAANKCSAPAAYHGSHLNLIKIINCASRIKKSNRLLTIMYTLFAVLGTVYFVYSAFSGLAGIPSPTTILIYELIVTVLSIIGFLIRKP